MGDMVVPGSQTRERRILVRGREAMGLGRKAFAQRLNEVMGPVEYPMRPVTWQAIDVWETVIRPPRVVIDAVLELLRVTDTPCSMVGLDWVDSDALVPA